MPILIYQYCILIIQYCKLQIIKLSEGKISMSLNPKNLGLAAAITSTLSQIIITTMQFAFALFNGQAGSGQIGIVFGYLLVNLPLSGVLYFCTAYVLAKIYNRFNRKP